MTFDLAAPNLRGLRTLREATPAEMREWVAAFKQLEAIMSEVIIRHKDGREYQIDSADFQRGKHAYDEKTGEMVTFVEAGFRIVSLPNGEPYRAPAERHHAAEQGKD